MWSMVISIFCISGPQASKGWEPLYWLHVHSSKLIRIANLSFAHNFSNGTYSQINVCEIAA